jgi:hypothetical protein
MGRCGLREGYVWECACACVVGSVVVIFEVAWCGCADDVCLCCVCGCVMLCGVASCGCCVLRYMRA